MTLSTKRSPIADQLSDRRVVGFRFLAPSDTMAWTRFWLGFEPSPGVAHFKAIGETARVSSQVTTTLLAQLAAPKAQQKRIDTRPTLRLVGWHHVVHAVRSGKRAITLPCLLCTRPPLWNLALGAYGCPEVVATRPQLLFAKLAKAGILTWAGREYLPGIRFEPEFANCWPSRVVAVAAGR